MGWDREIKLSTLVMGAMALTLCELEILISINTVLEINSSKERKHQRPQTFFKILPIKVIFHFKIRWLATLKFKDVLTENKKQKHLRDSGETVKEKKDWKKM